MMMMRQTSLIVAAIACCLLIQCAAAGMVPTGPAYPASMPPPPPSYSAPSADYASDPRFYQMQDEAQEQLNSGAFMQPLQEAQMVQPNGQRPIGFGSHLRDLSKVGVNSAQRAYADAKPALQNIRGDFGEVMNRVKTNPHVVKVVGATKPRVMQVVNRAQPIVANGGKKLNEFASKAQQRFQARMAARRAAQEQQQQQQNLAPGSVYPVPPANAAMPAGYE